MLHYPTLDIFPIAQTQNDAVNVLYRYVFSLTVTTPASKVVLSVSLANKWQHDHSIRTLKHKAETNLANFGRSTFSFTEQYSVSCDVFLLCTESTVDDRLVGLVVKASASRAEDPGFETRLRRDFFGVESYHWL